MIFLGCSCGNVQSLCTHVSFEATNKIICVGTKYGLRCENIMKALPKKVFRTFRISPEIDEQLTRFSELTGMSKTQIVEDALEAYFSGGIRESLRRQAKNILEAASSFNAPTIAVAA